MYSIVFVLCFTIGGFAQSRGHVGGPPAGGPHESHSNAGTTNSGDHGPRTAASQLSDRPALALKLQSLFPMGTDLGMAASGFKNLGQFVAAAHVANNMNIPFDQLKLKMLDGKMSLGNAIHALKPDISTATAKAEVKKAETEADEDTKS
jgi:hypothetical protein